jgi:uncharacterized protein YndB with AHSA1/START domain
MKKQISTYKPVQLFLAGLLLLTVSGCVYLRLLNIKNQLADFDTHFKIELKDGLTVHHLSPVLYNKDVLYLTKVIPSRVVEKEEGYTWTFEFEKLNQDNVTVETGKEIRFDMAFNRGNRINTFVFHEMFLQIVPPEFIEYSLRALGNAHVDKRERKVDADTSVWSGKMLEAPVVVAIRENLGVPISEVKDETALTLTYRYRLIVPEDTKVKEGNRFADVILIFEPESGKLNRLFVHFAGMKLSVNYKKYVDLSKQTAEG